MPTISSQSAIDRLERYIRARYPLIAVLSHEETRVLSALRTVAGARNRRLYTWSVTRGLQSPFPDLVGPKLDHTADPIAAFEAILAYADATKSQGSEPLNPPTLFVFLDLHAYLQDPIIVRSLRDLAARFEISRHTLVLLSPQLAIPPELEKTAVLLDWPLPSEEELAAILDQCERDLPERIPVTLNGNRAAVVQAMCGLTAFEAGSCLLSALAATGELGEAIIPHIVSEKRQVIRKSGLLEFYEASVTMSQVGGLPHLKRYAEIKRATFTEEARSFGVDPAKGVLLLGIPGTGKSLTAKAIAGGVLPLLRMDIGALFGSLVGQSESNMRNALKIAEAVAPAVLWIDELEKALGSSGGEQDGGTSARVFGTLLTWFQETTAPVYLVATANDVRSLKPELLRRFDDIVFVDLPSHADRLEILRIHLTQRRQDIASLDLEAVAAAAWSFTGAELEKVVKSALQNAFFNRQSLSTAHLLAAAEAIVPIAETMKEQIDSLRRWCQGRALPAADPIEPYPSGAGRTPKRSLEDL